MQHGKSKRKLGRTRDTRQALMRSLSEELIKREKITTTLAKAKELRPVVEKMVTRARVGTVASRRILRSRLATQTAVKKLVDDIAPRYKERSGGYTRITKIGRRAGDASPMAVIEFVNGKA